MDTSAACPAMIDDAAKRLRSTGYCVIPNLLPRAQVEALDAELADDFAVTPFCEGKFYGERTRRFGRVLMRSDHAGSLVAHSVVLGVVEQVLGPWADQVQLNLTQAISIHPGELAQMPHRDQKRGSHASVPTARKDHKRIVNIRKQVPRKVEGGNAGVTGDAMQCLRRDRNCCYPQSYTDKMLVQ